MRILESQVGQSFGADSKVKDRLKKEQTKANFQLRVQLAGSSSRALSFSPNSWQQLFSHLFEAWAEVILWWKSSLNLHAGAKRGQHSAGIDLDGPKYYGSPRFELYHVFPIINISFKTLNSQTCHCSLYTMLLPFIWFFLVYFSPLLFKNTQTRKTLGPKINFKCIFWVLIVGFC